MMKLTLIMMTWRCTQCTLINEAVKSDNGENKSKLYIKCAITKRINWIGGMTLDESNSDYELIQKREMTLDESNSMCPLGFLSSMQLYNEDPIKYLLTGSLNGIGDQVTALLWVKKYISSFGGIAYNITIWGVLLQYG